MSKISQLTEDTNPTSDDLVETVHDLAGTPVSRRVTLGNLSKGLGVAGSPFEMVVACSDESTPLVTGTTVITFRMPRGVTLTAVRASLTTPATTGTLTVDINEGGSSILSTKITIDAGEDTSATAATPPVISDAALADDAKMTVDIDDDADGTATGLKVTLIGTRA